MFKFTILSSQVVNMAELIEVQLAADAKCNSFYSYFVLFTDGTNTSDIPGSFV